MIEWRPGRELDHNRRVSDGPETLILITCPVVSEFAKDPGRCTTSTTRPDDVPAAAIDGAHGVLRI